MFLIVCFTISWGIWAPLLVPNGLPARTRWFLYFAGVIGPAVAAFLCASRKSLIERIARWRVPLQWYLVAALLPFLARGIAVLAIAAPFKPRPAGELLCVAVIVLLLVPLEEIGWRGYLLPHLQHRYSPLASSLIVGVIWTLWHAPLAWASVGYQRTSQPWPYMLTFFVTILPISCLVTWLFNRTGESIVIASLFHASVNMAEYALVLPARAGQRVLWLTTAILTVMVAVIWRRVFQLRQVAR